MLQTVNDRLSLIIRRGEVISISFEVELGETIAVFGGDNTGVWCENSPCINVGDRFLIRIPHNECSPIPRVGIVSAIATIANSSGTLRSLRFSNININHRFEGEGYLAKVPDMRGFFWRGITSNKAIGTPSPERMTASTIADSNRIMVRNGDLSIGDTITCRRVQIFDARVLSVERSGNLQRVEIDRLAPETVSNAVAFRAAGSIIDWTFTGYSNDPARFTASSSSGNTAFPSSNNILDLGLTEFFLCSGTDTRNPKESAIVLHVLSLPTYLLPDLL
jgi:hypothetical protein